MTLRTLVTRCLRRLCPPTPDGCAVAMAQPQRSVRVELLRGEVSRDVTELCAVAALRPFTLRLPKVDDGQKATTDDAVQLRIVDDITSDVVGELNLGPAALWSTAGVNLELREVVDGGHRGASPMRRRWDAWLRRRANIERSPSTAIVEPDDVERVMVFYSCPRPVYFVSVDDGDANNLFPMDLVGPLADDLFTLALRNTSPSVDTIHRARRVALADVPADARELAYRLGAHHKARHIDWDALPVAAIRTALFGLRIPDIALRVREIEVIDSRAIGSHMLFVGRILSERSIREGPQLFHTSGAYQAWLTARNRPFALAGQRR